MTVTGFRHDAGVFGSDEELLAIVVPFLDEASAAGHPAVVRVDGGQEALLRRHLAEPSAPAYVSDGAGHPMEVLRSVHAAATAQVQAGAAEVRVVGAVPHPGLDPAVAWEQWARYEAALNAMFASLPMWGLCLYDASRASAGVLEDVRATHTGLLQPDGREPSGDYVDPIRFLAGRKAVDYARLEAAPPLRELTDPRPDQVRQAVRHLAAHGELGTEVGADLVIAVNEVVTNAFRYGGRPVLVRGWAEDGRVLVTVRDSGRGIDDPFVGMLPPDGLENGGRGVWLSRLCTELLDFTRGREGFTVRMGARRR